MYSVFMECVPVSLGDLLAENLGIVKSRNSLHLGELVTVKWVRALRARHANQKVAHFITSYAMDKGANGTIKNRLYPLEIKKQCT